MLAIGFVAMMALPVAYRVWLISHPQPAAEHTPVARFLERSVEERAVRLLKTPAREWTDSDKNAEPKVFAWQLKHESTILPWDWSEEAKRKDTNGLVRLWRDLFAECDSELREQARRLEKDMRSLDLRVRIGETLYAHDTNQLAAIEHCLRTNSFPSTIQVRRLSKGRFWGWNTTTESLSFTNRLEACDEANGRGWLPEERKRIGRLYADVVKDKRERTSFRESLLDVSRRQDAVRTILKGLQGGESPDCKNLEAALSKIIRR